MACVRVSCQWQWLKCANKRSICEPIVWKKTAASPEKSCLIKDSSSATASPEFQAISFRHMGCYHGCVLGWAIRQLSPSMICGTCCERDQHNVSGSGIPRFPAWSGTRLPLPLHNILSNSRCCEVTCDHTLQFNRLSTGLEFAENLRFTF